MIVFNALLIIPYGVYFLNVLWNFKKFQNFIYRQTDVALEVFLSSAGSFHAFLFILLI